MGKESTRPRSDRGWETMLNRIIKYVHVGKTQSNKTSLIFVLIRCSYTAFFQRHISVIDSEQTEDGS